MSIWVDCAQRGFAANLIEEIRDRCLQGSEIAIDINAVAIKCQVDQSMVTDLLSIIEAKGIVKRVVSFRCRSCFQILSVKESESGKCPNCDNDTSELEALDGPIVNYVVVGMSSKDVDWVVTIHGMNTLGAWQEEYSWRLALLNRYSIPVSTFKYGIFRFGVMSSTRRIKAMRDLSDRILVHSARAKEAGLSERPDIIAHSFGTWLIGYALRDTDIKIGRLILTGCILPRDFNWASIVQAGKVEAILNHYGTRDFWAKVSVLIPGAGPSGRYGFTSDGVLNIAATGYRHSDFFRENALTQQFNGLWTQFLTAPINNLQSLLQGDLY